jgi:hypothetical protein
MVEEHDPVRAFEGGCDEAPHRLIAAEPVRKDHGPRAAATEDDMTALQRVHAVLKLGFMVLIIVS